MAFSVALRTFHARVVLKWPPSKEVETKKIIFLPNKRRLSQVRALETKSTSVVEEIKFKVGDFELHIKRNARSSQVSTHVSPLIETSTMVPLVPSKPKMEKITVSPSTAIEKSTPLDTTPFINVSIEKTSKIAALDASSANAYVLVSSPTVGVFRKARTLKGKKQPPSCKEGDIIKEGQIIGFLEQFGNELPVRSNVSEEVLKVLYKDEGNT